MQKILTIIPKEKHGFLRGFSATDSSELNREFGKIKAGIPGEKRRIFEVGRTDVSFGAIKMDEEEFENCYNHYKFQEDKDDPFSVAEIKRKCLALNFFGSIQLGEKNEITNYLLTKDLQAYSKIVDDQKGVNNYSESVLASLPPSQYENRRTWKTNLDTVNLEDFVKPLPCMSNSKKCGSLNIDKKWIQALRKSLKPTKPEVNIRNVREFSSGNLVQANIKPFFKPSKTGQCGKEFNLDAEKDTTCKNDNPKFKGIAFRTAREELHLQNLKKNKGQPSASQESSWTCAPVKKSLGTRKGGVFNKFQPPLKTNEKQLEQVKEPVVEEEEEEVDERLKNIDPKMIELIKSEIMDSGTAITWEDIAGLELAKNTIQEIVVWPMLRPDIFTGLRRPPKGILLFGPPGTGKTLIGKCIASQSCSTFFSISASSLTSKWIGDGEKMVRALFAVARCHQPSVVFIDEIDSLLSQRSDSEHESSRRLKTEFLVQLDGAGTAEDDRILIIGATNRPQELDEAARRRLVKRLYIPLPDEKAREQIIHNLISKERHCLTDSEVHEISVLCEGYSGADMKNLCQEASLGPIRSIPPMEIRRINPQDVRPLNVSDFKSALNRIKSSVSQGDLDIYIKWDKQYGCGSGL